MSPQRLNLRICMRFYREFDKIGSLYKNRHLRLHALWNVVSALFSDCFVLYEPH